MFCPNCGKQVPDGSKFCIGCGTPLNAGPVEETVKAVESFDAPAQVENAVEAAETAVQQPVESAFGAAQSTADSVFGTAQSTADSVFGSAQSTADSVFGSAQSTADSVFGTAQGAADSVFGSAQSTADSVFGTAQGAAETLDETVSAYSAAGSAAFGGADSAPVFGQQPQQPAYGANAQTYAQPQQYGTYQPQQQQGYAQPQQYGGYQQQTAVQQPKKKKTGLLIGIIAAAVVVIAVIVLLVTGVFGGGKSNGQKDYRKIIELYFDAFEDSDTKAMSALLLPELVDTLEDDYGYDFDTAIHGVDYWDDDYGTRISSYTIGDISDYDYDDLALALVGLSERDYERGIDVKVEVEYANGDTYLYDFDIVLTDGTWYLFMVW